MILMTSILLLVANVANSQVPIRDYRVRNSNDETPRPYSFSYNAVLDDGIGQISRTETADASGKVQGSYSLTNDEGHTRIVDYVADENGFRAHVRTNEPGTDNQNPADVIFESSSDFANRNFQNTPAIRPVIPRPVLNGGPVDPISVMRGPQQPRPQPQPQSRPIAVAHYLPYAKFP